MQLNQLPKEWKLFETVAGSHAYGTSTPESDIDIRGVFQMPTNKHLSLREPPERIADAKSDIEFHELKKFFCELLKAAPNVIELLWMPEDCVRLTTPKMQRIIDNRALFVTQKCFHSFSGYAYAQIKRAKGQNKWINRPMGEERPDKLDFCWVIDASDYEMAQAMIRTTLHYSNIQKLIDANRFPMRPVPASEWKLQLQDCAVAKLEHTENMYRLYSPPHAKGVFRNGNLVVESIPKEDEWSWFRGLLIFNEQAYEAAVRDWKNYWEWKKHRNEARYRTQEAGEIDYDSKSMLHCFRLLWSGKNILESGAPIVRFEGRQLEELMKIRNGGYTHEELMQWVEQEMSELEKLREVSGLPHEINVKKVDELYLDIRIGETK